MLKIISALVVILLLFGNITFAQKILLKKDGSTIEFKKKKDVKDGFLKINTVKEKIPIEKVEAYYSVTQQKTYCPIFTGQILKNQEWAFMPCILDGKIKAYAITVIMGDELAWTGIPPNFTNIDGAYVKNIANLLFLEKDNKTYYGSFNGNLSPVNLNNDSIKSGKELLKVLFQDDPIAVKALEATHQPDSASILGLINGYNARAHTSIISKSEQTGEITFLRATRGKDPKPLTIHINDSSYTWAAYGKLKLDLPTDVSTKFCIEYENETFCGLVKGNAYYPLHYELETQKDNNNMYIRHKKESEATQVLMQIYFYERKERKKAKKK